MCHNMFFKHYAISMNMFCIKHILYHHRWSELSWTQCFAAKQMPIAGDCQCCPSFCQTSTALNLSAFSKSIHFAEGSSDRLQTYNFFILLHVLDPLKIVCTSEQKLYRTLRFGLILSGLRRREKYMLWYGKQLWTVKFLGSFVGLFVGLFF